MVTLERTISLGDQVTVPFGRKRVVGTVIDTLRGRNGKKFVVSVPLDEDDSMVAAYDEDSLAPTA